MAVKNNRGRKRYILFSHSGDNSKNDMLNFIKNEIFALGGKITCKLIILQFKQIVTYY